MNPDAEEPWMTKCTEGQNVQTIAVQSLVAPVSDPREGLSGGFSYLPFRASHQTQRPAPTTFVNAGKNLAWYEHVCNLTDTVPEQGVFVLGDVLITGHLYVSYRGAFIVDGSEPNATALTFADQELSSGIDPLSRPNIIELDRPALVVAGAGYPIWGHWILDFLPRLGLASSIFGRNLDGFLIPLPDDTPAWVRKMMEFFCGVREESIVYYNRMTQGLVCHRAVMPTFCHDKGLHPFVLELYKPFTRDRGFPGPKNICVSRRLGAGATRSAVRVFHQQPYFESAAVRHGFEMVFPETMTFRDQVDLFSNADKIIGEFGSGMHSAIFSKPGTSVGAVGLLNSCQQRISTLCGHKTFYLLPDEQLGDSKQVIETRVRSMYRNGLFGVLSKRKTVLFACTVVVVIASTASPRLGFSQKLTDTLDGSTLNEPQAWRELDDTAAASGGRLLLIGPGQHDPGSIGDSGRNTWLILPGAKIAGGPSAMTDGSALQANFGIAVAKYQNLPGNESSVFLSTRIAHANQDAPSYQKNGLYVRLLQGDESTFASLGVRSGDRDVAFHDGVGIESQTSVTRGDKYGRIWSYHGASEVQEGADGRSVTAEFESLNFGIDQPATNYHNSKIGVNIVARGAVYSTAAISVVGAQDQKWHDGIVVNANGVASSAFAIRDVSRPGIVNLASIDADGSANFMALKSQGAPVAVRRFGTTAQRPAQLSQDHAGTFYFDTTLRKPIWWAGDAWVDALGMRV
jgi:hypothetical protein